MLIRNASTSAETDQGWTLAASSDPQLVEPLLDKELEAAAFDGARLRLARQRNGFNRAALARTVGVSPAAIGQFESRKARPSERTLTSLAVQLGLPVAYFAAGRPMLEADPDRTHFRSLRATRVGERQQALAVVAHLAELARVLGRAVHLPDPALGAARTGSAAESARGVRATWDLGEGPLPHLVEHLEQRGVVVATTQFGAAGRIDGFSCWIRDRPYVCLSRDRGDAHRRRFSAAHELGHLLLHPYAVPGHVAHEREADEFAAELLMPASAIRSSLPRRLDLAGLFELQDVWGVSVSALLRRSKELGVIDERAYRAGCILLARSRSELTARETHLPGEWPSLLSEALKAASGLGLTLDVLARGLRLPVTEVRDLLGIAADHRPRLVADSKPAGTAWEVIAVNQSNGRMATMKDSDA